MGAKNNTKRITIIGGSYYGNKGAQLMTEVAIQQIRAKSEKPVTFFIWVQDFKKNKEFCRDEDVILVSFNPWKYVLFILPALFLFKFTGVCIAKHNSMLQSCIESELFYDISGISFLDSRNMIFLLYDILNGTPARLLNKKNIKASQAFGPFQKGINKHIGPYYLSTYSKVYARGKLSAGAAYAANLDNVSEASDLGFAADTGFYTPEYNPESSVALSVSSVLYKKCRKQGINYIHLMSELCNHIHTVHNKDVKLIPHSIKVSDTLVNNDLPVAQWIASDVTNRLPDSIQLLNTINSPNELRTQIAECSFLVASRFHAMVNALSVGIPVFVLGWSHKYREVLEQFELASCHLPFHSINQEKLIDSFEHHFSNRKTYREKIERYGESVYRSSLHNFDLINKI